MGLERPTMGLWYDMDACSQPQQEGTETDTILSAMLGKCGLYQTVTLKRKTNTTVRQELRDWRVNSRVSVGKKSK